MQRPEKWLLAGVLAALVLGSRGAPALPVDSAPKQVAGTEPGKPAPKPEEVRALMAKLGDADWQVRDKAMQDLIALRGAARDALRAALASPDPEVRWRAGYVISLLDVDLAFPATNPARTLYAQAAQASARQGGEAEARTLYAKVVQEYPDTPWAEAARERLAALGPAKPAADEKAPDGAAIARLVSQLGSAEWSKRQEASSRLAALGAAARPALEAAAAGPDPETAWRARRLLERLAATQPPPDPQPAPAADPRIEVTLIGEAARPRLLPGYTSDFDLLIAALAANDGPQTARAREVLLNLGQDAVAPLVRALAACDEPTGVEIMDLLSQITKARLGFTPSRWQAWWRERQERGK